MLPKDLTGKYQSSVTSLQSPVVSLQSPVVSLQSPVFGSSLVWQAFSVCSFVAA